MVYCGKPSGGCHSCRQKRTRCDQKPEGCGQCKASGRKCPGYRVLGNIIFRDESENVIRKLKTQEAKKKSARVKTGASRFLSLNFDDESRPEEALKTIQQQSPTPTFALTPSPEEQAILFFVANYVVRDYGPMKGHVNYLASLYQCEHLDEAVIGSMKAVGYAGYAHLINAPALMRNARYEYGKALRALNAALRCPIDVQKDTTLIAVMILGIFETATGSNLKSLLAWRNHLTGASALLKVRDRGQPRTPAGRRLFFQVVNNLVISCIRLAQPLPEFIVEWTTEAKNLSSITDPTYIIHEAMIAFTNFRASVINKTCSDPHFILARALELDNIYVTVFNDTPEGWKYQTVYTDAEPGTVFNGYFHLYRDYWNTQLWNSVRVVRILLHIQIRSTLLDGFATKPPLFNHPAHAAQFQTSTDTLYRLQADILASVPQHLGVVSPHSMPSLNPSTTLNEEQASTALPWNNFRDNSNDNFPVIRLSGSLFLIWPLWFAAMIDIASDSVRDYAIRNLESIGRKTGVNQAIFLARSIRTQMKIT